MQRSFEVDRVARAPGGHLVDSACRHDDALPPSRLENLPLPSDRSSSGSARNAVRHRPSESVCWAARAAPTGRASPCLPYSRVDLRVKGRSALRRQGARTVRDSTVLLQKPSCRRETGSFAYDVREVATPELRHLGPRMRSGICRPCSGGSPGASSLTPPQGGGPDGGDRVALVHVADGRAASHVPSGESPASMRRTFSTTSGARARSRS